MGMTIDNAKQLLSQYQKLFNSLNGDYKLSQVQASELSHSIGTALDTMRKYQNIEEILNEDFEAHHPLDRDTYKLFLIRTVLEDGNNDN